MSKRIHPAAKIREIAPNPAGGAWPEISNAVADETVDHVHAQMDRLFKRVIVPSFLANQRGRVKPTAEMIATLFIGFLHNFLADNRVEGEVKNFDQMAETVATCMDFASTQMRLVHKLTEMGMPQPIISAMLHNLVSDAGKPEIKVFEIKPGQELPEELRRFLDI